MKNKAPHPKCLHLLTEEEIYTRASEFIPERWYLYPEMVKDKSAWAPFSIGTSNCPSLPFPSLFPLPPIYCPHSSHFLTKLPPAGPYSCIGKSFALMNIRTTTARLIMGFDIKFAPAEQGDQGRRFEKETKDHLTLAPAKLEICFTKRG